MTDGTPLTPAATTDGPPASTQPPTPPGKGRLRLATTLMVVAILAVIGVCVRVGFHLAGGQARRDLAEARAMLDSPDPQTVVDGLERMQLFRLREHAREAGLSKLDHPYWGVRETAMRLLAMREVLPEDASVLRARLGDPSAAVRYLAGRLLQRLGSPAVDAGVVRRLPLTLEGAGRRVPAGVDAAVLAGTLFEAAVAGDATAWRMVLELRPLLTDGVRAESDRDLAAMVQPLRCSHGFGVAPLLPGTPGFEEAVAWAGRHVDAATFDAWQRGARARELRRAYYRKVVREYDRIGEWAGARGIGPEGNRGLR